MKSNEGDVPARVTRGEWEESRNRRILIVDDNPAIHRDFRKILAEETVGTHEIDELESALFGEPEPTDDLFELESASQGREGLQRVKDALEGGNPYAVAFVDVRMPPGWDGIETSRYLLQEDPELQIVICTAYSDHDWSEIVQLSDDTDRVLILKKPFDAIEVQLMAYSLTKKWALSKRALGRKRELEALVQARTAELEAINDKLRQEMAQREYMERALRLTQKLDALGELAGGIAHDFNNLLTPIKGLTELVRDDLPQGDPRREDLDEVLTSADRAAELIQGLMIFARQGSTELRLVHVNECLVALEKLLRRTLGEHITLSVDVDDRPSVIQAAETQLDRVIINLAVNARDAMPEGGRLRIASRTVDLDNETPADLSPGRYVRIEVEDCGTGMDEEAVAHIFEPFFTDKPPGKGTGLGLSICYGVIQQLGGNIDLETQLGVGTTFIIHIPCVEGTPISPSQKQPSADKSKLGGKETILVIEDEAGVRRFVENLLKRYGYSVLVAEDGVKGLELFQAHEESIDLVFSDVVLPRGNGFEVADVVRRSSPKTPVLLTSGYTDRGHVRWDGQFPIFKKPYSAENLLLWIRKRLETSRVDAQDQSS